MTWPATNREYADKTPTIIAYNNEGVPPTWGGKVKLTTRQPKVTHFKLGLEPNVPQYLGLQGTNESGSTGGNTFGKCPQLPLKTPKDFVADYLTCISKFVHEVYFPGQWAPGFMQRQRMIYYITVPAIWKDGAKTLTREAASQALGVPNEKLVLITEPEAAALYCATTCQEVDLTDGDRFLVCDAGGGTVVCLIPSLKSNFRI
jgi:hypothetical protein